MLNKLALKQLNAQSTLKIIPHTTYLFKEKDTLDEVAHITASWLKYI